MAYNPNEPRDKDGKWSGGGGGGKKPRLQTSQEFHRMKEMGIANMDHPSYEHYLHAAGHKVGTTQVVSFPPRHTKRDRRK